MVANIITLAMVVVCIAVLLKVLGRFKLEKDFHDKAERRTGIVRGMAMGRDPRWGNLIIQIDGYGEYNINLYDCKGEFINTLTHPLDSLVDAECYEYKTFTGKTMHEVRVADWDYEYGITLIEFTRHMIVGAIAIGIIIYMQLFGMEHIYFFFGWAKSWIVFGFQHLQSMILGWINSY